MLNYHLPPNHNKYIKYLHITWVSMALGSSMGQAMQGGLGHDITLNLYTLYLVTQVVFGSSPSAIYTW